MKILYIDCFSGIAGDMLLGAFVDAGLDPELLYGLPEKLNLPQVKVAIGKVVKKGIAATKVDVHFPHEHVHRNLEMITAIIQKADLPAAVKQTALSAFEKLAAAEACIHNVPVEKIHFHEVGALDAIIDIVGAAVALDAFDLDAVYVSDIALGSGTVQMAHGVYPVPAPAVVALLEGFSVTQGPVDRELTTPTGAALLSVMVTGKGKPPAYHIQAQGYGAGTADFEKMPNVLRLTIGMVNETTESDSLLMLECNIDDMDTRVYPHVIEQLLAHGALEAFLTPVIMKKGRPGFMLHALCPAEKEAALLDVFFRETTTIGIRRQKYDRVKLHRKELVVNTAYGTMRVKEIVLPNGETRRRAEFDDLQSAAMRTGIPLHTLMENVDFEINVSG